MLQPSPQRILETPHLLAAEDRCRERELRLLSQRSGPAQRIVDPDTLKINAIIEWEYGGFWPEWFEQPYWKRKGPGAPIGDEEDDRERYRGWLSVHCVEVEMEHLLSLTERLEGQK